ncbi:MAG: CopG family ribbon-helix-helix protein [Pseudomonas helleri]|uniref:CopG family ribbon-helix-helix protein n=1 Tax=Pseudomonas helleri TaxID=1608996 RepID=UPI003FD0F349
MNTTQYDSRTADKFVVRLPEGLRDKVDAAAVADDRSMNSIIVQAIKQYLDTQNRQELLLNALASAGATGPKSMAVSKPQADPRDLFVKLNPTGAYEAELEMERGGFVDHRTHADYLIFLAGYRAATPDQAERTPEDSSVVTQSMHIDDRVKMAANARRYEWLRARPLNNEDEVWIQLARDNSVCPDRWALGGNDPEGCDAAIDRAMRLAPIEGLQPCAD